MDAIGKTVARIEERPRDNTFGYVRDDTVLIHFTDGTALEIVGHSYEDVEQEVGLLSQQTVRRFARAAQGAREAERLKRLQRQEWLSLSCEERGERKRAAQAKLSPLSLAMRAEIADSYSDLMRHQSRLLFGQEAQTVRKRCKNCGAYECPNATLEYIDATPPLAGGFKPTNFAQFEIKIEPGSLPG